MTITKGSTNAGTKARAGSVKNGRYTYKAADGDASATRIVRFKGKAYKVNSNVVG